MTNKEFNKLVARVYYRMIALDMSREAYDRQVRFEKWFPLR